MEKSMKLKKLAVIMLITLITMLGFSTTSKVYAATGSMYLKVVMLRSSGYGYKALEKNIWKITETNSTGTTTDYSKTIYCLKGGPGFGSSNFGSGTTSVRHYTRYFDMKDKSSITSPYSNALPSSEVTYNSLLWLLDNVYIAPKTNASASEKTQAEEYKEELLKRAGISNTVLTDDDIDAVQQLAVWHFTNDDEYKIEDGGTFEFWINAIANSDANYNPMSEDINENGLYRAEECQMLYDYLVNTATSMGSSDYTSAKAGTVPYQITDLNQTITTNGDNYVIGPFKIEKLYNNTTATFSGYIKNGATTINPTLQDANGNVFDSLESTIGKEFFVVLPKTTEINTISLEISGSYYETTATYWSVEGAPTDDQPVVHIERTYHTYSYSEEFIPSIFDLALRKFIIGVNDKELKDENGKYTREPQISTTTLDNLKKGTTSTAEKVHTKEPLIVNTGDKVIYKIRVYNEGQVDGYVKEITDYLPAGLKFVENSTVNTNNGWTNPSGDKKTIVTNKLSGTLLKAFDGENLQYLDVEIECEVTAEVGQANISLKNIAEITKHSDASGNETVIDRDSTPDNVDIDNYGTTSQEDDDDFEQLVILGQYFDLSLRKFIIGVNDKELKDENGKYTREPVVNITPLINGETTATYNHPKEAVNVEVGDIVIYVIRVYNEGKQDGYVTEITDHLPEYLEYINDEFNASYGWKVSGDGRTVTTTITSPNTEYSASRDLIYGNRSTEEDKVLLKAFDNEKLDYIDIQIKCKVQETEIAEKVTNIADITGFTNKNGNTVIDRDSSEDNVRLPSDDELPEYKEAEIKRGETYIPGQQDDDDFEKVIIEKFDLSLRKFITGVNDTEVNNRVPVFSMDSNKNYVYTHPKTPVEVANGDVIIYTLRIFNEGNQAGYATEVKDDLPEGLVYLPENELNKEYRWKMYKEDGTETTNVEEAKTIRTDYLSKEQADSTGRDNLIEAFNKETMSMPDFKDIKIAFKVTEPNTSDRILINTAEISNDSDEEGEPVEDVDSTPDNDKEGEDDIDIEKVKVKYFDLNLKKIITEVSMKLDGKTTVTKTGHTFEQLPEPVVKVELGNHKIKTAVIKFKYKIRVSNEGEIAGYVTEIRDYIPEGLKFVKEDNKKWTLSEDGKTVTTDQLKGTLLEPGESATVEITLQWINGQNNLGVKTNIAEISKDYNEHEDTDDIDSTPDNFKEGEDDIDDASVVLTIVTGVGENYTLIIASVLAMLSTGIILIKKYVL